MPDQTWNQTFCNLCYVNCGLEVATKDGELHVTGADAARVGMIAYEARVPVLGLAEKENSLEDAFLELTEEDAR